MSLETNIENFAKFLKKGGKTDATIDSYCRDAKRFDDYLEDEGVAQGDLEPSILLKYQEFLRHEIQEKDNSIRRTVIGVRQYYRYLMANKVIGTGSGQSPFDFVAIPARDESLPKGLASEDIDELFEVCGPEGLKGARDRAILALLALEGVKASELIALKPKDLLITNDTASLRIAGTRSRSILPGTSTRHFLQKYLAEFQRLPESTGGRNEERSLFVAFKGRDSSVPFPNMTRHGLKFILYELGEKAGVKNVNTESLRHFAVDRMIMLGKEPDAIMHHLGLRRMGNISKHFKRHSEKSLTSSAYEPRLFPGDATS